MSAVTIPIGDNRQFFIVGFYCEYEYSIILCSSVGTALKWLEVFFGTGLRQRRTSSNRQAPVSRPQKVCKFWLWWWSYPYRRHHSFVLGLNGWKQDLNIIVYMSPEGSWQTSGPMGPACCSSVLQSNDLHPNRAAGRNLNFFVVTEWLQFTLPISPRFRCRRPHWEWQHDSLSTRNSITFTDETEKMAVSLYIELSGMKRCLKLFVIETIDFWSEVKGIDSTTRALVFLCCCSSLQISAWHGYSHFDSSVH